MRRSTLLLLASASVLAIAATARPRYGGVLRVELRRPVIDVLLDDRFAPAVFDRLISLDGRGEPKAALAVSWQSEAGRWRFRLRPGVRFHDGTPLTAAIAAGALEAAGATAGADSVTLPASIPLTELARPRYPIFRKTPEGAISGTGPFRVAEFAPGRGLVLSANEEHWAGRPFLDQIQVRLGADSSGDIVEGSLNRPLGAAPWVSSPANLLALVLPAGDPKIREAIALSVDRVAIHSVLLRKQGAVAAGLLPQWLSGYSFLFAPSRDQARVRQLAASPLTVGYDPADPLERAIAERVAVNAREAGVTLRATPGPAAARVVRLRITSRDPGIALAEIAAALGLGSTKPPVTLEACYLMERSLLDGYRVIPLAHVPDIVNLGPRVRNWTGWNLDTVWLAP
jgi:ABC-type transport system substrate-binding protein